MKTFYFIFCTVIVFAGCKQEEKKSVDSFSSATKDSILVSATPVSNYTAPDLSPMDMIYCPADYPFKKMSGEAAELPYARIIYSRPQTQGRKIFGELVKYNQPWRMGANEATELELFSAVTIQGKIIQPGRYIMFCIPSETDWTIILNSNIFSWGLIPDKKKNIMHFSFPVAKNNTITEYFTMAFQNSGSQATLLILWDDVKVILPMMF